MRSRLHPIDAALAEALSTIEPAIKDRLLRRLLGFSPQAAADSELFDALAIDKIVPVSVNANIPLQVKIGGQGNLVASSALVGKVTSCSQGVFTYTPLAGFCGPDQFAIRDGSGKVTLIRISVR